MQMNNAEDAKKLLSEYDLEDRKNYHRSIKFSFMSERSFTKEQLVEEILTRYDRPDEFISALIDELAKERIAGGLVAALKYDPGYVEKIADLQVKFSSYDHCDYDDEKYKTLAWSFCSEKTLRREIENFIGDSGKPLDLQDKYVKAMLKNPNLTPELQEKFLQKIDKEDKTQLYQLYACMVDTVYLQEYSDRYIGDDFEQKDDITYNKVAALYQKICDEDPEFKKYVHDRDIRNNSSEAKLPYDAVLKAFETTNVGIKMLLNEGIITQNMQQNLPIDLVPLAIEKGMDLEFCARAVLKKSSWCAYPDDALNNDVYPHRYQPLRDLDECRHKLFQTLLDKGLDTRKIDNIEVSKDFILPLVKAGINDDLANRLWIDDYDYIKHLYQKANQPPQKIADGMLRRLKYEIREGIAFGFKKVNIRELADFMKEHPEVKIAGEDMQVLAKEFYNAKYKQASGDCNNWLAWKIRAYEQLFENTQLRSEMMKFYKEFQKQDEFKATKIELQSVKQRLDDMINKKKVLEGSQKDVDKMSIEQKNQIFQELKTKISQNPNLLEGHLAVMCNIYASKTNTPEQKAEYFEQLHDIRKSGKTNAEKREMAHIFERVLKRNPELAKDEALKGLAKIDYQAIGYTPTKRGFTLNSTERQA